MGLKLNLGSGQSNYEGYINVDKFGEPDIRHDLETFPWPWEDSSVSRIIMFHILEHLGGTPQVFLSIMQELYRVCEHNAVIKISVPHPRHDCFIHDPTHVRPITKACLDLFNKRLNREWIEMNAPNSKLGLYLDVDFEVTRHVFVLDEPWQSDFQSGAVTEKQVLDAVRCYNNVVKRIDMDLVVRKQPSDQVSEVS